MKILFIIDPVKKLNTAWDNSLAVARELQRRGHENWCADARDFKASGKTVRVRAKRLLAKSFPDSPPPWSGADFKISAAQTLDVMSFDLAIIRKEPPVDARYFAMTNLLERAADRGLPVINHPAGIRNNNEKLAILNFPRWIPETLVSALPREILDFQKRLGADLVIKPLDEKGGKGVFKLTRSRPSKTLLGRATHKGTKPVMAQRFLTPAHAEEKRILILNGELFAAYIKRPQKGEFRANLDLGGTFHATRLTVREKKLITDLRPFLIKQGLWFVGIDVLDEKLIEINVTSPAGVTEATVLRPQAGLIGAWADFLEAFARRKRRR